MSTAIAPIENLSAAQLDQLCINTIRTLSIDAVQQAKSGHPGTPMALAPLVYTIWNRVLSFDPRNPIWPNRDRFVLSNGHASISVARKPSIPITRHSASPRLLSMTFAASASSTAKLRATRSTTGFQVLRPQPVRLARA
jgi:Transketolase, thiamine diphosphate binding domain